MIDTSGSKELMLIPAIDIKFWLGCRTTFHTSDICQRALEAVQCEETNYEL